MNEEDEGLNWPERAFKNKPDELEKHFEQRKSRGFSDADWWSFDTFIAGVIGQAVKKFRNEGVGYPSDSTPEDWLSVCDSIWVPLLKYADMKFKVFTNEEEKELHDNAVEAMRKFSERLGDWWD
jgi:hypothetical protein